jgi:hypothetical protein
MRHYIVTRLGLGVARRADFALRIALLRNTLLPSLLAQSCGDFLWSVVTDVMIDPQSEAELRGLLEGRPGFDVEKVDTFAAGSMDIPAAAMCERRFGTTHDILFTRIDDDDAVSRDFVAVLQAAMAGRSGLTAASLLDGALLDVADGRMASERKTGSGVGLSILSPDAARFGPYSFSHNSAHARVLEMGGAVVETPTDRPMWLNVLYDFSDSRETKGGAERIASLIDRGEVMGEAEAAALLLDFGLSPTLAADLRREVEQHPVSRASLLDSHIPRLNLKTEILRMAQERRARTERGGATRKVERQLAALKVSYYAL